MEQRTRELLSTVLESGVWGTIGPHSIESAKLLADTTGAAYGLLTVSWTSALDSLLRGLGITRGDAVLVPAYSSPELSLTVLCVGAEPVFCEMETADGAVSADDVEAKLNAHLPIKAVLTDALPDCMPDAGRLSALCRQHGIPLIFAAHGYLSARCNGKPLTDFADAVLYSIGEGSEADCGGGGVVTTNRIDIHSGAYAYHNCGRSFGEGCTLDCDKLIGGDARITEWIACQVGPAMEKPAAAVRPERCRMPDQPVFRGHI